MTKYLDADVTIAYVQALAKEWRRDEAHWSEPFPLMSHRRARSARDKATVLEDLAQQLEQQAVKVT